MVGKKIQLFFGEKFDVNKPIFVEEFITQSVTLHEWMNDKLKTKNARQLNRTDKSELSEVMIQIVGFIHLFRTNYAGTHNDFHSKNILVQTFDERILVPITDTIQITTKHVVRVIDFGMSSFTYGTETLDLYNETTHHDRIEALKYWYECDIFDLDNLDTEAKYYSIDNYQIHELLHEYALIMDIDPLYTDTMEDRGHKLDTFDKIRKIMKHVNDCTHGDIRTLFKSRNDFFIDNYVHKTSFNKTVYLQNLCDLIKDEDHIISHQQRKLEGFKEIYKNVIV